jgi:hypothetical protein
VITINVTAFWDELEKIAVQSRSPFSPWKSQTVGAPRTKLPPIQMDKAPTLSGNLSPKLVGPASQYGKRQNYSQSNTDVAPTVNPMMGSSERSVPTPNVVFGAR